MENIVDTEKMKALEALAATNMEISRAKEAFALLKKSEDAYLFEREKKAQELVEGVLQGSKEVLKEAHSYFAEAKDFQNIVKSFAASIAEMSGEVKKVVDAFESKQAAWEESINGQQQEIEHQKRALISEKAALVSAKAHVESEKKANNEFNRRLMDERATINRAIERLKKNKI